MKKLILFTLICSCLAFSPKSWAWGKTGHRVVAEVACHHLTDKAKKKIKAILKGQPMAAVANWMDDIKSDTNPDLDTLRDYHWVTIPDGKTYAESNINPKGDVIQGIHIAFQKLKNGNLSPKMERIYLKMLIHFVGDLHQPLHVGRGSDRGGNTIRLTWFGHKTNLHRLWDSNMIDDKKYSYTELANIVDCTATSKEVKKWQSGTVASWAQECVQLRPQIYNFNPSEKYWEYHYEYRNWKTVESQLEKGGIRLAGLLNELFG